MPIPRTIAIEPTGLVPLGLQARNHDKVNWYNDTVYQVTVHPPQCLSPALPVNIGPGDVGPVHPLQANHSNGPQPYTVDVRDAVTLNIVTQMNGTIDVS